jgi:hypothetical protein
MPGVRAVPANGHSLGHSAYLFQSEGQDLMGWDDIVHSHTVQFARPDVSIEFDVDSDAALNIGSGLPVRICLFPVWVTSAVKALRFLGCLWNTALCAWTAKRVHRGIRRKKLPACGV